MRADLLIIAINDINSQPSLVPLLILVATIEIHPSLRHTFPQLTNLPRLVDVPAYLCTIKEERGVDVIAPDFPMLHCADKASLMLENRIALNNFEQQRQNFLAFVNSELSKKSSSPTTCYSTHVVKNCRTMWMKAECVSSVSRHGAMKLKPSTQSSKS